MKSWYQPRTPWFLKLLLPLSWIALKVVERRRRHRNRQSYSVPVVVVGNINVGGTGKTPMIQALTRLLGDRGLRVGIVSRGYGGQSTQYPLEVTRETTPFQCGDEPQLLFDTLAVPVFVDPDRHRAVITLLSRYRVDIVISDDGLQHYAMARDIELVMVDGRRGLGNRHMLPAGPLREPVNRLESVDFLIAKGEPPYGLDVDAVAEMELSTPINAHSRPLPIGQPVSVVTAIGDGEGFTHSIRQLGYSVTSTNYFSDHAIIPEALLSRLTGSVVVTEKDAVKLDLSKYPEIYVAAMRFILPAAFIERLLQRIEEIRHEKSTDYSG